jgi:pyruvate-formate lyase
MARIPTGLWQRDVNVRWFLQRNYTPYDGDGAFLAAVTERTQSIWKKLEAMFVEERKKNGVLDVSQIPSSITAHAPGYIDRENEVIVSQDAQRGVFDAYTADIRACRSSHILTGAARRLWPRAHHRGLPPGCALWRGAADRAEGAGKGWPSTAPCLRTTSSVIARNCGLKMGQFRDAGCNAR